MDKREAFEKMLEILEQGDGVLTAPAIHPDIPTIDDVGNNTGRRIRTLTEVRHCGFGLFMAETPHGSISFDGGGAMSRCEEFSFTPLRVREPGALAWMGYDAERAKAAVVNF